MSSARATGQDVAVRAENIGGIDTAELTLSEGVTALAGRNATNRTSFLQAIMAALGSENVSIKSDADRGEVTLELGGRTYTRVLERENGTIATSGDPYLDDPEVADLFAFLLRSNEARRAVVGGEELRELMMRPIDTDALQAEIRELEAEKQELDGELEALESLESDLPDLEQRRAKLEDRIETEREALREKREQVEAMDADVDETREDKAALERRLEEFHGARSDLEDVRARLDQERASLDSLCDERRELTDERDDLPAVPTEELERVEAQIGQLRERKQSVESTIGQLQRVVQFNEEMLGDGPSEVQRTLGGREATAAGDVTDQLLSDGREVVCWTCGSEVERSAVDETLERLKELRREKVEERNSITQELDALKDERDDLQEAQQRRERLDRKLAAVEDEIDDREAAIEQLEERRASLEERTDRLEDEIEALEHREYSSLLALHKEVNRLEFELETLEDELEETEREIDAVEKRLAERDRLEERRDGVQSELEDRRTRIEQIETEAVEEFNRHMENLLGVLEYRNIERIWIDRREHEVRDGRRTTTQRTFDMHVVRTTDDGTSYEDTIDHLSESEREVAGLVFALAGYLAHDVHETVPFMLLDSLEAIDANRIAALIDYFRDYATYLVAALLPEDAAALDDRCQLVTEF